MWVILSLYSIPQVPYMYYICVRKVTGILWGFFLRFLAKLLKSTTTGALERKQLKNRWCHPPQLVMKYTNSLTSRPLPQLSV